MPHSAETKTRIGAVILLRSDGAALLQLRDDKPGLRNAGMWVPPGGHAEPGETIETCARREFREETEYDCEQLNWLCEFEDAVPGWPAYALTVFWSRYDGRQTYTCHEGQALEFVSRQHAAARKSPPYLAQLWDLALTAAQANSYTLTMPNFTVPYTAFPLKNASIKQQLMQAFEAVLDSGRYILGPECAAFEREFADYCHAKHATGMANGTCALHLALRDAGVGAGDEVITVSNSFIATAASIAHAGGRPVFVDVLPDLNIDPAKIEAAINSKTKAIIPVHLTGRPARMCEVMAIAKKHDLFVLEDAAQAVGAKLASRRVGSWGDAAAFSLHPLKNLHAFGDGGMMTSNNLEFCERVAKRRNHGLKNREQCDLWGYNCRLDEVQAAVLRVQLRELDRWTEERRRLAFHYNELLQPYDEVPTEGPDEHHVYQTYVVQCDRRDELKQFLVANGVEALVHYPVPIHLQPAAKELGYTARDLPVTMRVCARILSLPLYPGLTEAQQDIVVKLFKNFYRG